MRLYLVRHGQAQPEFVDPARPLTGWGREETQKVAEALQKMGAPIDRIIHSGKKRAEQTALIMQKNLAPDCPVDVRNDIAPNDPVDPVFEAIQTFKRDVMIVSHLPLLPKLASRIIAKSEHPEILHFKDSTVAVLEKRPDGSWRLECLMSPEAL